MGYMGFGMRKEVYTRKPRKAFAYLKKLYGEQLEKHFQTTHIQAVQGIQLSEAEWREFRREVKERVRHDNQQRIRAALVSILVTVAVLFALVWLLREWFGF